jgi:hypothetical protein
MLRPVQHVSAAGDVCLITKQLARGFPVATHELNSHATPNHRIAVPEKVCGSICSFAFVGAHPAKRRAVSKGIQGKTKYRSRQPSDQLKRRISLVPSTTPRGRAYAEEIDASPFLGGLWPVCPGTTL